MVEMLAVATKKNANVFVLVQAFSPKKERDENTSLGNFSIEYLLASALL